MSKITSDHLQRGAFVYVRQSTVDQVLHNHESRRRQYALADRARDLGWSRVEVIDDDLGRSGAGTTRPGFERLLAAICEGSVGAVVSIEASRLARNGRDWHTLLEFCGIVGTLIIDEDGIYDARHPNDRLLLGMKGTMSEMELSMFRQRSVEALRQKARRGELFMNVATGYVRSSREHIEKDPDRRVQTAISLVFTKFAELQSIRQVHLWMRSEQILLPAVSYAAEGRTTAWKAPVYNTVYHMLTNPIYAGVYAFGRTKSRVVIHDGRKRIVRGFRKEQDAWDVLLPDHHEGYITFADFERNQRLISDNANGKSFMSRGSVRRGSVLLAGLLRCGHCGRKLTVAYGGTKGDVGRYHCRGGHINHGAKPCISLGSLRIDRAIGNDVVERLQPLGIEAAIAAVEAHGVEHLEKQRQVALALEQARYNASHAARQYDAVDPDNRIVAAELERRWNERLQIAHDLEVELETALGHPAVTLGNVERERLMSLGRDVERAWNSPGSSPTTRKKIVRTLIDEIVVRLEENEVSLVVRWCGGDHTALKVRRNRIGEHRWQVDTDVFEMVTNLARLMPDKAIAAVLNRAGKTTGRGNGWTSSRVKSLRQRQDIPVYHDGERHERGELTLDETARLLEVSHSTVQRMIAEQLLPAKQLCRGAPWVIRNADIETVRHHAASRKLRRPASEDSRQKTLSL
jgi:DNA invertase Pin-like site-specific DNA recombinase/AraC-like DNA-binding protein